MDGRSAELASPIIGGSVPAIAPSFEQFGARAAAFVRASKSPATARIGAIGRISQGGVAAPG
jgi:hypothetical protein